MTVVWNVDDRAVEDAEIVWRIGKDFLPLPPRFGVALLKGV